MRFDKNGLPLMSSLVKQIFDANQTLVSFFSMMFWSNRQTLIGSNLSPKHRGREKISFPQFLLFVTKYRNWKPYSCFTYIKEYFGVSQMAQWLPFEKCLLFSQQVIFRAIFFFYKFSFGITIKVSFPLMSY